MGSLDNVDPLRSSNWGADDVDQLQGDDDDSSSCPSDCESGISDPRNECRSRVLSNGLIRIGDGEIIHESIKRKLSSSLRSSGLNDARVEGILRVDYSGIMRQAKIQCFWTYSRAMEVKCGGHANVKWAWYGGSKHEISRIVAYGFGLIADAQSDGHGLILYPVDNLMESVGASDGDEDGVRRVLLCRVILGKVEAICPASRQYCPSSEEFDSGVDNLVSPQKYIVWRSRMNTHILPEFVVGFRISFQPQPQGRERKVQKPKSDWMPFPSLIAVLSRILPPDAVELIAGFHNDIRKKKIRRQDMIGRVRHIAGDDLLMSIINIYTAKQKAVQCPLPPIGRTTATSAHNLHF